MNAGHRAYCCWLVRGSLMAWICWHGALASAQELRPLPAPEPAQVLEHDALEDDALDATGDDVNRVQDVAAAAGHTSPNVLDRYRKDSGLPELPAYSHSPEGLSGPPFACYYGARTKNWVQADYLLWWLQGQAVNTLVADPNGSVLGGDRLNDSVRSGLRVRAGHYFDCDATCGFMAEFWQLETLGDDTFVSDGALNSFVLPFTDMDLTLASNQVNGCACVDQITGTAASIPLDALAVDSRSSIWSGGAYYRGRLDSCYRCQADCCCRGGVCRYGHRLDGIFGYRYMNLDETLTTSTSLVPAAGIINGSDFFDTQNQFHGLDAGLIYEREYGRWGLETLGRVALGINQQELTVAGTGSRNGGIFAQSTNIGTFAHDAVTVIPEFNCSLSYALTPRLRARFGYSFLWLSNVIRPAKQIDTRLDGRVFDLNQSPPFNNPPLFFPRQKFETESVWLQGLNFGVEYWF